MTALFVVIFVEQWMDKRSNRIPELIGVAMAILSLVIFGAENFVLPAMLAIVALLFVGRKKLEQEGTKCQ
jgi:4-azaleucine resistance transporter AzlC